MHASCLGPCFGASRDRHTLGIQASATVVSSQECIGIEPTRWIGFGDLISQGRIMAAASAALDSNKKRRRRTIKKIMMTTIVIVMK